MEIFTSIFLKPLVSSKEIKSEMAAFERMRRRKLIDLRMAENGKARVVSQIKHARAEGRQEIIDRIWLEMGDLRSESAALCHDIRRAGLQYLTLKRCLPYVRRFERTSDPEGLTLLAKRIRESRLEPLLKQDDMNETAYLDELDVIITEMSGRGTELGPAEDDEKTRFIESIDAVLRAESDGRIEEARRREGELRASVAVREPMPPAEQPLEQPAGPLRSGAGFEKTLDTDAKHGL